MKRLLKLDWDAIAGVVATVLAIVMHFLHMIEEDFLLTIAVVLIALLFLRDLRRERHTEKIDETLLQTQLTLNEIQTKLIPPDVIVGRPTANLYNN